MARGKESVTPRPATPAGAAPPPSAPRGLPFRPGILAKGRVVAAAEIAVVVRHRVEGVRGRLLHQLWVLQ